MTTPEFLAPTETTPEPTPETPSDATEFEPILSQEDFDKRTQARIKRATAKFADYSELQSKAQRLAELEQAQLSEAERQAERIKALETELKNERHGNLRRDVAAAKGVPAHRISGTTREELEQSAEEYIAEIAERSTPPKPKAAMGRSGATTTNTYTDKKEHAAAALRAWHSNT